MSNRIIKYISHLVHSGTAFTCLTAAAVLSENCFSRENIFLCLTAKEYNI